MEEEEEEETFRARTWLVVTRVYMLLCFFAFQIFDAASLRIQHGSEMLDSVSKLVALLLSFAYDFQRCGVPFLPVRVLIPIGEPF